MLNSVLSGYKKNEEKIQVKWSNYCNFTRSEVRGGAQALSGREVRLGQLEGNTGIQLENSRFSTNNVESDEWQ